MGCPMGCCPYGVPYGVVTPPQSVSLREQLSRRRSGLEDVPSDGDSSVWGHGVILRSRGHPGVIQGHGVTVGSW